MKALFQTVTRLWDRTCRAWVGSIHGKCEGMRGKCKAEGGARWLVRLRQGDYTSIKYPQELSHSKNGKPRMLCQKKFGALPVSFHLRFHGYFGIISRASLLATTSRSSLRFFPESIIASREP
jgi:hypothetical protein